MLRTSGAWIIHGSGSSASGLLIASSAISYSASATMNVTRVFARPPAASMPARSCSPNIGLSAQKPSTMLLPSP